ncbi:hypothetical protein LX77_02143 [Gelidibacter algens]|uniref:Lipoprotein n=1 Tax=Gelidibacter algens TaxID=49280 RepID=A0A1A7QR61_9FLAO|nr:hypothetical protein [Gelidibacter algens]OBX22520.1 hypothetical protein A9996_16915 [Gelidibacter algens]RAJ22984.1 hypothetical protein LX77_02143 [Gelidibacter algens]
MKTKAFQILFAITLFVSCGPKPSKSLSVITKETNTYISKVEVNANFKTEVTEGALTDTEGFQDIGKFKYTVFFDSQTKGLYKIHNIEITNTSISETYYFKDGDLVLIDGNLGGSPSKMYVQNGKIISESKYDAAAQKMLLEKAKRFQKAFQKEH